LKPRSDSPGQCLIGTANCQIQAQRFANARVGWVTYYTTGTGAETYLFRTEDAGQHWRSVLGWDGSHEPTVVSGPDGKEVLVLSACCTGASIFHSSDGGVHWAAYGLPAGAGAHFLNPRDGYAGVYDAQTRSNVLFHTTDSGAHWSRIARIEWNPDLDPIEEGSLVALPSSLGYFSRSRTLYLSDDGGATWREVLAGRPEQTPAAVTFIGGFQFFNARDGVLTSYYCSESSCGYRGAPDLAYVYSTSDGGDHWSEPVRLPTDAVGFSQTIFIDPNDWIAEIRDLTPTGYGIRRVIHTSDAGRHWTVLVAPADPNGYLTDWDQFGSIQFTDPMHGFAFTGGPDLNQPVTSLRMTSNGGVTWNAVPLPASIIQANTR
jgi:photosystem II stability/assembly factor-like uncharacterized protein